jgi:signal peptidase I
VAGLFALVRVLRLLVAAALVAAIVLVAAGAVPTMFGYESFTVYSGSMEPAIRVGALAVVQPVPAAQLREGDVITFRSRNQPDIVVTHRLTSIVRSPDGRTEFRTKGDANETEDSVQVEGSSVLGRVAYSVPFAGYVVDAARRPQGRILLLGVPALLLLLDYLRGVLRPTKTAPRAVPDV